MIRLKKGISLVINTKNEEKNIVDCIRSAKAISDEIIIADMNSTDRTREIAEKEGAKVYRVKDYNYVEPARNFAINKATNTWVLLLDADERLTSFLCKQLKKIMKEDKYDVIQIPFQNILLNKWMRHSGWWPIHQVRFFKKGYVKWKNKIHSSPAIKGKVLNLPLEKKYSIIHYNISSIAEMLKKVDSYSSQEHNFTLKSITTPRKLISYYESEFNWRYIDQEGYKDGMHGFILSKFMEFYRFLEIAKAWEKNAYKEFTNNTLLKEAIEAKVFAKESDWNLKYLKRKNAELKDTIDEIYSSKFFQLWQWYTKIKDMISLKKPS